jgi:hypothetical protein
MFEGITGALLVIGGYLGRVLSEWFGETRQEQRETRRRRQEFQSRALLELQEEMFKVLRGHATAYHHNLRAFREHGRWRSGHLSEGEDEELRLAMARVNILTARVDDDTVRGLVKDVIYLLGGSVVADTREESERSYDAAREVFDELNKRIGELLRSH